MTKRSNHFDIRLVLLYILAFAAGGVIQPFLNLYLIEVGLSGTEIGAILGWASLLTVLSTPFIGYLADRFQLHRLIFAIITFVKGISAPLMLLSNAWIWLGFTVTLRVLTAGASDAMLTPLTFVYLRDKVRNQNLGAIRFWGVIGFSVASLLAGYLSRGKSLGTLFPLAAIFATISLPFFKVLPRSVLESGTEISRHTIELKRPSFSSPLLILNFAAFFFWFTYSGPEAFGNIYLAQTLGAGNDLIGMIGAISVFFQLPGFLLADRLNEHFGIKETLLIGLVFFGIAWSGYLIIRSPFQILPFTAAEGIGRALYTISLFVLFKNLSQAQRASTNLMIVNITLPGLAGMLAKPFSGWTYDLLGGQKLFCIDILLLVVLIILLYVLFKKKNLEPWIGEA